MVNGILLALMHSAQNAAGNVSGGINFDVSIGDLATIATTLIAVVSSYTRLAERITRVETKVDAMWGEFVDRRKLPRG